MKNYLSFIVLSALVSVVFFTSCVDKEPTIQFSNEVLELPDVPFDYDDFSAVSNLVNAPVQNQFINFINGNLARFERRGFLSNNPEITNDGATLGRVLFYDKKLSLNNSVSCASCHHQANAFADPVEFSTGFEGRKTSRNSMSIINVGLSTNLFWDSRSHSVKSMTLEPVQNHIEMGLESLELLKNKLQATEYYPALFEKAYGSDRLTVDRISDALTQFLASMMTFNSKFDHAAINDFETFTPAELKGMNLFVSNCSGCHGNESFGAVDTHGQYRESNGTANIGLDLNYQDNGRENGKFKIPPLRNIALSAPYMHDGRFNTLEEVIDHYNSGVKNHPNLDSKLKSSTGPRKMNFTEDDKQALVAFLNTLTDETFIRDEKFSNPFKQ